MKKIFKLNKYKRKQLWTREFARQIRDELNVILNEINTGDTLIIDAKDIEVFDYSFANELFGKTLISLSTENVGKFLVVENLTDYCRENLSKALESLNLIVIEKIDAKYRLLGNVHPADQETFEQFLKANKPLTANDLRENLGINITAANERLSKLIKLAIIRRENVVSKAGRQQFQYLTLG
jgi:hypothetical protein